MKIAVVGSGIAGLGCAWALRDRHDVTLYEKQERLGGHSNTVDVDYDGRHIAVDTGFIVFNNATYPNLTALFEHLGVATEPSSMTFSVSAGNGAFEWGGPFIRSVFAQKRNALNPAFHAMLLDMVKFKRHAARDLAEGRLARLSIRDYLETRGFSKAFRRDYLVPMGAAIWSTNPSEFLSFPAETLVRFLENHRLTSMDWVIWRTVSGGSRSYVRKIAAALEGRIRLATGVTRITREAAGVAITDTRGETHRYDEVVIAAHSDEARAMLADISSDEDALLARLRYAPNRAVLHRDPALMPRRRNAWAAWNFVTAARKDPFDGDAGQVSVSYCMNLLQNIPHATPLFVSLNPLQEPDPRLTFASFAYDHPQFDRAALDAQAQLWRIQGVRRTWFCGAYAGYGFHEDGLTSGLEVAERLGGRIPWGTIAKPRIFPPQLAEAAE